MILGVTLARGGSKGIPGKNIAPCAGKPLLAWTIEAAKKAKLLDRYVVCTEDDLIAKVARDNGAEVLWRPPTLADDNVNRWDVLKFVLTKIDADDVVLLQATSPVRPAGMIDGCIMQYRRDHNDSLATGFYHHDERYPENRGKNRQLMTPRFFDDGNVYIWRASLIKENGVQECGKHPAIKINERAAQIDINEPFDLWMAEQVLKNADL